MEFGSEKKIIKVRDVIEITGDSGQAEISDNAKIEVLKILEVTWSYGKHGIDGVRTEIEARYFSNDIKIIEDKRKLFRIVK